MGSAVCHAMHAMHMQRICKLRRGTQVQIFRVGTHNSDIVKRGHACMSAISGHHFFVRLHACRALDKVAAPEDKPPTKEVLQLRADLFERLGWAHWARQEASRIKDAFPAAYPLF